MTKSNERNLYTIKDISNSTGIHPQTLRNWEKEGLLNPFRISGNQRIYTQEDLDRINEIMNLKEEGYQIKGIRNVLVGKTVKRTRTPKDESPVVEVRQNKRQHLTAAAAVATPIIKNETQPISAPARRGRKPSKPKFSIQDLNNMNLKELTDLAQQENVKYFRQMFKDEWVTALAYPERREEMKEQAKLRTKERYGGRVYGERKKRLESQIKEVEDIKDAVGNINNAIEEINDTVQEVLEMAQETEPTIEELANQEGLVEDESDLESVEENGYDKQTDLIKEILNLGTKGKTPQEIAKILIKNHSAE